MDEYSDDHGLFGPDSVTWRIHVDPVMWVAAFYALAVQALHPPSMWGTYQNSSLFDRKEALARLLRTGDWVSTRTFGTTAEVDKIGRRVRAIHRKLHGTNPETGERFPVDDPENLRYIHCGEIVAYLRVAQRAGVPLTAAEADTYVDEQRRSAAVVGLEPSFVPGSVAELDDYFAMMRPQLRLTAEARRGILMWANYPTPPHLAALKVVYPAFATLSMTLLPGWARRCYGLPSYDFPPAYAAATATLRATRLAMLAAPDRFQGTELQIRHTRRARELMRTREAVAA